MDTTGSGRGKGGMKGGSRGVLILRHGVCSFCPGWGLKFGHVAPYVDSAKMCVYVCVPDRGVMGLFC